MRYTYTFLLLVASFFLSHCEYYDASEIRTSITDQDVLEITRIGDKAIPADGLTPVTLNVALQSTKSGKSQKVTLTTSDGTFSNGTKTIEVVPRTTLETGTVSASVILKSSANIGSVVVEAAIGDIHDQVIIDFVEVNFKLEVDGTNAPFEGNGVTKVPINFTLIPNLESTDFSKRTVSLTASSGVFPNGESTLTLILKGKSDTTIHITTPASVGNTLVAAKYFDVEKKVSFQTSKVFPQAVSLKGEEVFMLDSAGTRFMLSATISHTNGIPSAGHAVTFDVSDLDAMGLPVDGVFQTVTKTDAGGVATAVFTLLSSISPGDLNFYATTIGDQGIDLQSETTVRVLPAN